MIVEFNFDNLDSIKLLVQDARQKIVRSIYNSLRDIERYQNSKESFLFWHPKRIEGPRTEDDVEVWLNNHSAETGFGGWEIKFNDALIDWKRLHRNAYLLKEIMEFDRLYGIINSPVFITPPPESIQFESSVYTDIIKFARRKQ